MGDLLTPQEVASQLKVTKNTVYELVKRGDLKGFKIGKQLRVDSDEIELYKSGVSKGVIVCGQDMILDILCNYLEDEPYRFKAYRSRQGSYNGLFALYQGQVSVATAHLWDGDKDIYNMPYVKRMLPGVQASVFHLVKRMQGYYVRSGNPLAIHSWEDLGRSDLVFINRERGSGVRILVDEQLRIRQIPVCDVAGYRNEAGSHLAIAAAVAKGEADYGVGNEKACCQVEGIDFIPLKQECYDLIIKDEDLEEPFARAILEIIRSDKFACEIESIGGYDISELGKKA